MMFGKPLFQILHKNMKGCGLFRMQYNAWVFGIY